MTFGLSTVCFVIALILFVLAALPIPVPLSLTNLGLAFVAAGLAVGGP